MSIFSISFVFLKKWSKWPPCLFIERLHIFQNYRRFCDKVITCVPKNDFCKKFRPNYHTLVVQISITFEKST